MDRVSILLTWSTALLVREEHGAQADVWLLVRRSVLIIPLPFAEQLSAREVWYGYGRVGDRRRCCPPEIIS